MCHKNNDFYEQKTKQSSLEEKLIKSQIELPTTKKLRINNKYSHKNILGISKFQKRKTP